MKCEKIQEWILTDYLDNCMDPLNEKILEEHLENCPSCRAFLKIAAKTVKEPFAQAAKAPLSEDLIWSRIQKNIVFDDELIPEDVSQPLARPQWKEIFSFPRPALVFSAVATIFFLTMIFRPTSDNPPEIVQKQETQAEGYVDYLLTDYEYGLAYENGDSESELDAYYL